jgi:Winged helix-turn-helix
MDFKKISNPLTIIAIFAGLAEINGTVVISLIPQPLQETFLWFIILFPTFLVIAFFFILFKKPHVLYAPSDFNDETNFLEVINWQGGNQLIDKLAKEENIQDLLDYGANFEIVKEGENHIINDLTHRGVIVDLEDQIVKILIRQLAASQGLLWFEKTYSSIFGSQIQILEEGLNSEDFNISKKYIEDVYNNTKFENFKTLHSWSLNDYLKFLLSSGLLRQDSEYYFLTKRGQEFLDMLANSNYSKDKNL